MITTNFRLKNSFAVLLLTAATALCLFGFIPLANATPGAPPVTITSSSPTSNTSVNGTFLTVYTLSGEINGGDITFTRTGGAVDFGSHVYNFQRDDESIGQHTLDIRGLETSFANSLVDGTVYSVTFHALDAVGNPLTSLITTSVTYDLTPPTAPSRIHITSNNGIYNLAKAGDTVTVTADVDTGTRVSGTIGGRAVATYSVVGSTATISRVLDGTETEGPGLNFTMVSIDAAENVSSTVTKTVITDESSVQTDFTAPSAPIATPGAGSYTNTQNVVLSSVGSNLIRFTTDGSVPTCSIGTLYSGAISISSTTLLVARGCDWTGNGSFIASYNYTIGSSGGGGSSSSSPSAPTASPYAGTYAGVQNISLSSSGSTFIRFTTDGTTPSCSIGTIYTGTIYVSASQTIKAKGCNATGLASSLSSFIYTILPPSAPTATPAAGTLAGTQLVTLFSMGSASIRYSTNGSTPSCSVGTVYNGSISVSSSQTIKAIGCTVAGVASVVDAFIYTILPPVAPTATPTSGTYAGTQTVILSSVGSNMIRYTVDGSNPTCSVGTIFPGSISIPNSRVIKVVGCTAAGIPSVVSTFFYTINPAVGGGTVNPEPTSVSIHDPALYQQILIDFELQSDPAAFEIYKTLIQSDAKFFGITLTAEQLRAIANFVTYGASTETIKLGAGERRALIRDYFETVVRGDVVWDDMRRLTIGQKPVKRNLAKEQSQTGIALDAFKTITGHGPNFQMLTEDIAWNTMLYRIRFPRNLVKEQLGIGQFQKIFKHTPGTPFEWAIVRAIGYALN